LLPRIVLCVTTSWPAFLAVTYITAVTTVTPQIMLPLVGDLAPPKRRATALSIVVSGFILGILVARVLSGTVTNYTSWRNIYWMALGLQYIIFILLWFFMPDYPRTNTQHINYFALLWSIISMLFKHAVLVQACLISFFTTATFTSFWTTLTFLLAGAPYFYDPIYIGLFGLIGILAMFFGPPYAKYVTDQFHPLVSVIVGNLICLVGIVIGTYAGQHSAAAPAIQAFLNDWGLQTAQIANRASIYGIEPKARNRLNTAFMVATFCGQLMGTAAGNHIYADGGWIHSGSASVGFIGAALFFCFVRGPYETRWVGWRGGWSLRKKPKNDEPGAEWVNHKDGQKGGGEEGESGGNGKEETNTEKALDEIAGEDEEERVAREKAAEEERDAEKSRDVSSESSVEGGRREDDIRPTDAKA